MDDARPGQDPTGCSSRECDINRSRVVIGAYNTANGVKGTKIVVADQ